MITAETTETAMETKTEIPSAARLSRVEAVLANEPAFKGKLGKKTVTVTKRDGKKVNFSQEVVDVGVAIQAAGKDAVTISKKEILEYAVKVLGTENSQALASTPAIVPEASASATESVEKSAEVSYVVPCLSLIVGAKQMAELIDGDKQKVAKLISLLSDAQAVVSELQ
jgi:hypothetical protein